MAIKEANCIALWHDKYAVFLTRNAFVLLDFANKSFKTIPIPEDNKLPTKPDITPLWVESTSKPLTAK